MLGRTSVDRFNKAQHIIALKKFRARPREQCFEAMTLTSIPLRNCQRTFQAAKSGNSQTITSNKSMTRGLLHIFLILFCQKRWLLQSFIHYRHRISDNANEVLATQQPREDRMKLYHGESCPSHRFEKTLEAFKR